MERTLTLKTEGDMEALGMRIAQALPHGGFVALYGDLGAGKTVLSRGAGRALGLDHLSSPTFTIVQEYPTAPPLFHFDAYRLADEDELYAMGPGEDEGCAMDDCGSMEPDVYQVEEVEDNE